MIESFRKPIRIGQCCDPLGKVGPAPSDAKGQTADSCARDDTDKARGEYVGVASESSR